MWAGFSVGGVAVEVEEVVEAFLGGVEVGGDTVCSGSAAVSLVEEDGFLDAGEGVEESGYGEVEADLGGASAHEVGDLYGQDAGEAVDTDLVVDEVEHGGERHDFGVFELPEGGFDVALGAVGATMLAMVHSLRLVNRIRFPKYWCVLGLLETLKCGTMDGHARQTQRSHNS